MSLLVPVQTAASLALKRYLEQNLPTDISVSSTWPDSEKRLPPRAITIIPAGPRKLTFMDEPILLGDESLGVGSFNKIYKWLIAECEQPYQLDVWTQFPSDRDDIVARLDQILNAGFSALSTASVSTPTVDRGLSLEMGDGWEDSIAYYSFDSFKYDETPDQVTRQEYRATYSGMGAFNLTQKAIKPAIAKVEFKIKLTGCDSYTTFNAQ